jgi:hypothetical protein
MPIKLICVHPFHNYVRGQEVLDPEEVAAHLEDREHHFVKVNFTEHDHVRLKEMRAAAQEEAHAAIDRAATAQASRVPKSVDKP